jgi:hypothetical protein
VGKRSLFTGAKGEELFNRECDRMNMIYRMVVWQLRSSSSGRRVSTVFLTLAGIVDDGVLLIVHRWLAELGALCQVALKDQLAAVLVEAISQMPAAALMAQSN